MKMQRTVRLAFVAIGASLSCAPAPTAVIQGSASLVWDPAQCSDVDYVHVESGGRNASVAVMDRRGVSRSVFRQHEGSVLTASRCGDTFFVVSISADKLVPYDPATGGRLSRSSDGGRTWRVLEVPSRHGVRGAACLGMKSVYAWSDDEVLFSDDAGGTWTTKDLPGTFEPQPSPRLAPDGALWVVRGALSRAPLVVRLDRRLDYRVWRIDTTFTAERFVVAPDGRLWFGGSSSLTNFQFADWIPGQARPSVRFEFPGTGGIVALETKGREVGALIWMLSEKTLVDAPVYYVASETGGERWTVRRMPKNSCTFGCLSENAIWHVSTEGELYLLPR